MLQNLRPKSIFAQSSEEIKSPETDKHQNPFNKDTQSSRRQDICALQKIKLEQKEFLKRLKNIPDNCLFGIKSVLLLTLMIMVTQCQGQGLPFNVDVAIDNSQINANAIYTFTMAVEKYELLQYTPLFIFLANQFLIYYFYRVDQGLLVKVVIPYELNVQTTSGSLISYCKEDTYNLSPPSSTNANLNCLYTSDPVLLQNYITFTTPTNYPDLSTYAWSFGYIKNPASAKRWDQMSSFQVSVTGGTPSGSITTNLAVTYFPGPIYSHTLTQSNTNAKAGGIENYVFKFKITNNIPRDGAIEFTFPSPAWSAVPGNIATITSVSLYGTSTGTVTATIATLDVQFGNIFPLSGLTASSSSYIIVTFTGITDPRTTGTTTSFSITTLDDSGYQIDTITSGLQVSVPLPGDVTISQFNPLSYMVDTQTTLVFKIVPPVTFTTGGYIQVEGAPLYIRSSSPAICSATTGFMGGSTTCTVPNTNTVRQFRDIQNNPTLVSFTINSFVNPLGVVALPSYFLYLKNSDGTTVSQAITGMTYTTTPGICTVTSLARDPASLVVGATNAIYKINFFCQHRITSTGRINMIFPSDQVEYSASTTCQDGITVSTAIPCTVSQVSGLLQVTATQWCSTTSSDCPANVALSLRLVSAKNPGYIVPTLTSSVTIQTMNQINSQWLVVDQLTTGIVFPQNLIPGFISNLNVVRAGTPPLLTGAVTTFTFTFTSQNQIPSGGYAKITFPDKTAYQNQPTPSLSCSSNVGSGTCASVGSPSDTKIVLTVSWTAVCTSTCSASTAFTITVTNAYNPFSTASNSLIIYSVSTHTSLGYMIDAGTKSQAMPSLIPNQLTASLSAPSTPITVGAVSTYTILVQNPNNYIPSLSNGGSLVVVLPSETLLQSASCTASTSSITLTCSASIATQKLTVTSPSDLPKASTITVSMSNNVRNPQTGAPSSTFSIYTYYNAAGIDISQTLKVTCNTPNLIVNPTSTRALATINSATTFSLSFQTTNPIPAGSVIYYQLPNDQAVLTISGSATISATHSSGTSSRAISFSSPYYSFNIPEWCSASNGGASCPATTTSTVQLAGFSNPSTAVAPSISIKIDIKTAPPDNFIIDSVSIGLFTTPYVNYGPLASVTITRSSDIVGALTTLTLVFITNSNAQAVLSGSVVNVFLALPVSFLYQKSGGTTCTSKITPNAVPLPQTCSPTIGATDPQNMGNYVQSIVFGLPCSTSSPCPSSTSFTVTVSGLINPYNTKANTGTLTTATQSQLTSGGPMSVINSFDSVIGITLGAVLNSYTPNIITVNSITRSVTTVGATVVVTFDLKLTNRLQKNGYIIIVVPTEQFVPNGSTFKYQSYFGGSYSADQTLTQTSSSSTQNTFQIKEWCNGGANYCPDDYNLKFRITLGLNNLGYVAVPTSFFTIITKTSDLLGSSDQLTNALATPPLTAAVLTINSVMLSNNQVATVGVNVDISVKFGATVSNGNLILFVFSTEFIRVDQNALTCADFTTGTAVAASCTYTNTNGILNSVTITGMCTSSCSATSTYVIRLLNVNNILSQVAFSGTLTVSTMKSLIFQISTGSYTLSTITTLVPGTLFSTSVVRSQALQGKVSSFTISWKTPGILLSDSVVEINLPLNQIIIQSGTSAFVTKDSSNGNTLTYSVMSGSPTPTYNNIKFAKQWKCSSSTFCMPTLTFSLTITSSANPFVQSSLYNDFKIKIYTVATGAAIFQSPAPLLALPALEFGIISNIVITMFSSVYVSMTPTYTISFTTSSDTPQGGKFKIQFPIGRAVQYSSTSLACVSASGVTLSCSASWSAGVQTLFVNNQCPAAVCPAGTYSFTFSGNMKNPSTVPTTDFNFIIDSTDSSGNIINEGKILNSLVTPILPGSLTSATVIRGSTSLSASTEYTVTFTTVNTVPSTGYFRIVIALDQVQVPTGPPICKMGFSLTLVSCPIIFKSSTLEYIDIAQTCGSSGCAAGTSVSIVISDVSNPSTFSANQVTSSWSVYTMTSAKELIDGKSTGLQATPPLVGRSVLVLLVEMDSYVVATNTNLRIAFIPGASFTNAALFDVYFPDGFATSTSNQNTCQLLDGITYNMQCIFSNYPSGYLQKVQLLNPCPNSCNSVSSYIYQMPITTRGDVYQVGSSFTVICRYQYVDVGMGILPNALSLMPATITKYYIYNQNCDTVDQLCALYLTFRLINQVPTSSSRGRIAIQIPSQVKVKIPTCQTIIDSSTYGMSCSISGSTIYATHSSMSSVAGLNITIRMNQIQNPASTAPTDSFQIQTEWDVLNNKKYYAIDQITNGLFYQVHICTPLLNLKVTRSQGPANSGYMTGQPTTLWVKFTLKHSLVATSAFQITLPTQAEVMLNPLANSYTCYQTDSSGNNLNLLLCDFQSGNNTILVRNYCQVGECGNEDSVNFKMYDDFIQNYYYVIAPSDINTQSVAVRTTTAGGLYFVDQGQVIPTPGLQPTPLIMPSPEVIRTSNIIGQKVSWVINFKINKNPVPSGGYVTINIPQGVLLPFSSTSLEIYNYDTKRPYSNYTYNLYSDGKSIQSIQLNNFCNSTQSCNIGSAFSVQFDWVKNPMVQLNVNSPITVQTRTKQGYYVELGTTAVVNSLFSQLIPVSLENVFLRPVDPTCKATTTYEISFSSDADFAPTDVLALTFPIETTVLTTTTARILAPSVSSSRCRSLLDISIKVTCAVISQNLVHLYGVFKNNDKTYTVSVANVLNPPNSMTTSAMFINVQNPDGLLIAGKYTNTNIVIHPAVIIDQSSCNKVCGSCSGTVSTCTSCVVPSKYPLFKQFTCTDECGDGYFLHYAQPLANQSTNLPQCLQCHQACQQCYGAGNNKCIACSSGYFMENGLCVPYCTKGITQDSKLNQCVNTNKTCSSNCQTCSTNTSYCLSCDKSKSSSVYDPTQGKCIASNQYLCNNSNSERFYIDTTSSTTRNPQCKICSSLCRSCQNSADQCTACWGADFFTNRVINELYQTCVEKCGLGTWFNSTANTCSFCNPVSLLCTGYGADQCLVCNKTPEGHQLYLLDQTCVLECPQKYTTNPLSNSCDKGQANIMSFSFIFMFAAIIIGALIVLTSLLIARRKDKSLDILYAVTSMLEFLNRICVLGNLWVHTSVFSITVCFMNLIATCVIGVFFNSLFMTPIFAHSPHFRQIYRKHTCTYQTVTAISYFAGVNVMRLLCSNMYALLQLKADLINYKFYLAPLNTMANFTIVFTICQFGLCLFVLLTYTVSDDVFILALFGLVMNMLLIILQLFKHLSTKAFLAKNTT